MFLLRAYCGRADCGMGPAESAHATRRSYRRPGGVYHFFTSALDSGIVLRKEALGMGDVLLLRRFRWLGGGVITAQRCFNRLMLRPDICRYYKKRINHTAFWTVFKSGRYSNTLSTGIVLMITTSLSK